MTVGFFNFVTTLKLITYAHLDIPEIDRVRVNLIIIKYIKSKTVYDVYKKNVNVA